MLTIGWACRDVTPHRPALLQGQKHRRIASEASDPLTVTAMAIEDADAGEQAVIVSCDIAYPSDGLIAAVRRQVAEKAPGIQPDRIVLTATHTHDSLVIEDGFYDPPPPGVMTPAECEAHLAAGIIEAIAQAWTTRQPAGIARAFGHAVVGHNRHAVYADGHAQMYGSTNREDFIWFGGIEDHSVNMLFAWRPDGALAGVALSIACPSQVEEHLETFSADFWHEVRIELRRRLGDQLQVLGLCSAAGDQSPHFLLYGPQERAMRERRGVSERQEIALRIADAVERALACTQPDEAMNGPLRHDVEVVPLPPRSISQAERDWAEAAHRQSVEQGDATSWWPMRLRQVVDHFEGTVVAEPYDAELHVIRLGDLAIATNPFELFLDYGLRIKARSAAGQTMLVQLTGRGFYLPTRRAVEGGGYGAMPAVSIVGPEGGDQLVDHTVERIASLF